MSLNKPAKGKSPKARSGFTLPAIRAVLGYDAMSQIRVWRRARLYLTPAGRGEWNRTRGRGKKLPSFDELRVYIDAIEGHWQHLRSEQRLNPDFFQWPSTIAWLGDGCFDFEKDLESGVLSTFGYSVNQEDNLDEATRLRLLDEIFHVNLPPVFYPQTLTDWDDPASAGRLRKMANCLAAFSRNAKRRIHRDLSLAVEKWETDLRYLRHRYYIEHFGFDWPRSDLGL